MLIDKKGRKWESVQEWIDMCRSYNCDDCPVCSCNNSYNLNCYVFAKEHPQEALERLTKAGILREEDDSKEKGEIPPLCEVLRVQPNQEFIYEGTRYRITPQGERQVWFQLGHKWCWDSSCATLEEMIQERDKIQIQREVRLTEEQKEELKKVKRMLPGAKRVYWSNGELKLEMRAGLGSWEYELNLDVEMPEGLDYELEEEE